MLVSLLKPTNATRDWFRLSNSPHRSNSVTDLVKIVIAALSTVTAIMIAMIGTLPAAWSAISIATAVTTVMIAMWFVM